MAYKLLKRQLEEISRLPIWIQEYKDKYPVSVSNIALDYYKPPLPHDYPISDSDIEIYYTDEEPQVDLFIRESKIKRFNIDRPSNPNVIRVFIDGECIYVELEGKTLFNRLGAVKLPTVVMDLHTCAAIILPEITEEKND